MSVLHAEKSVNTGQNTRASMQSKKNVQPVKDSIESCAIPPTLLCTYILHHGQYNINKMHF